MKTTHPRGCGFIALYIAISSAALVPARELMCMYVRSCDHAMRMRDLLAITCTSYKFEPLLMDERAS